MKIMKNNSYLKLLSKVCKKKIPEMENIVKKDMCLDTKYAYLSVILLASPTNSNVKNWIGWVSKWKAMPKYLSL